MRKKIIAMTSSIWINDPSTWKPRNPISQSTRSTTAIVVSIYVMFLTNKPQWYNNIISIALFVRKRGKWGDH